MNILFALTVAKILCLYTYVHFYAYVHIYTYIKLLEKESIIIMELLGLFLVQ